METPLSQSINYMLPLLFAFLFDSRVRDLHHSIAGWLAGCKIKCFFIATQRTPLPRPLMEMILGNTHTHTRTSSTASTPQPNLVHWL